MPILQRSSIRMSGCHKRNALVLLALSAALIGAFLLSLRCGSQEYTVSQLLKAALAGDRENVIWRVLVHARLPRTVAAAVAGAALALAGALIQAVLNNAMASPNVIGVNAGAGFFSLLAAVVVPEAVRLTPFAAFVGALLTAFLVYLLAVRAGLSRTSLILAGLAVSSMLTAGTNMIVLLAPELVLEASSFMLGGFSGVTLKMVGNAAGYLLLGGALAMLLAPDLNVLKLGEESAAALGLHVSRVRSLAILAAALLAGGAVSFCGLLGFVGLLVPHAARWLVGGDDRWLFPAAALLGGAFVLVCDVLARVLFAPFVLPVGVLMSLLGGPFFLYLLLSRKGGRIYA